MSQPRACSCNTMTATNWDKFKLLLWKNCVQIFAHKCNLCLILLFSLYPIVYMFMVIQVNSIEKIKEKRFQPLEVSNLQIFTDEMAKGSQIPELKLLYSPNTNKIFEEIVKNAVESLKLDGYQGFANPSDLTNTLMSGNFLAGVQFDDTQKYPNKLSFALRFPSELRTNGSFTWLTTTLFSQNKASILRNADDEDGGVPVGYLREGFLPIQDAISKAYIKMAGKMDTLPDIQVQRYPHPDHIAFFISGFPVLFFYFGYCCGVLYFTKLSQAIALENEKQLKEMMKIMGLQNWILWAAWFAYAFIWFGIIFIIASVEITTVFGGEALLYESSFTAVLFFFMAFAVSSICMTFMIATLCRKAGIAEMMTLLIFIGSILPYTYLIIYFFDLGLAEILFWSFLPLTGLAFGGAVIEVLELTGEGLQWNNMFSAELVDGRITMGYIILAMLASSVIFMLICLYTEQILPGEFGVARKWNFPLTSNFWCGEKKNVDEEEIHSDDVHRRDPDAFEAEPAGKHAGIQVKNLKKKFGEHEVVKDISMNMYEDEISVLLGHNGAGKTITISMLAGILSPTSGTAIINGFDICTNLQGARQSIGICTQHNVLFDDLSVKRHIVFFSVLKGLKGEALQEEVEKYLKMINLEDKSGVLSSELSGGMKRKLSICCAMCGGSKVVLLDEPSAGMDPVARRQLWDLLQSEKSGRTLLLTTHLMDEADVLGDRIAILCDGELKCYGTSFYLKNKYGSGYYLICVKGENCNVEAVTAMLKKYIPNIKPEIGIGTELTYKLPKSHTPVFEKMFRALEENSERLNLNGYGVGIKSLEEIFIKMGAENNNDDTRKGQSAILNESSGFPEDDLESIQSESNTRLLKGTELVRNHWKAMFLKNCLFALHNKSVYLLQIFFIILIIPRLLYLRNENPFDELRPITMSLNQYPSAVTILEQDASLKALGPDTLEIQIADYYKKVANSFGPEYTFESTGTSSFTDYILNLEKISQLVINKHYLAAASVSKGKIIVWLNNHPLHTAPLSLNMVHNALAKALINSDAEITVINAPLPYTAESRIHLLENGLGQGFGVIDLFVGFVFSLLIASYIPHLTKDNLSGVNLLQLISGVSFWTFWISQWICDLVTFTAMALIYMICITCFQAGGFANISELACYFLIILLFGLSVLPLAYILSNCCVDPDCAFSCSWVLFMLIAFIPDFVSDKWLLYWRILPQISLRLGLQKIYQNWATRVTCNSPHMEKLTDDLRCQLLPVCCSDISYFGWSQIGALPEIVYLVITAFAYMLLLILLENSQCCKMETKSKKKKDTTLLDNDVAAERERILSMSEDEIAGHNLVMDRVSRRFLKLLAVNEVSLCVKQSECFGLLGSNGAGKTTIFKMLTGELEMSAGSAYVKGMKLTDKMQQIYKEISYCPQSDALFDNLTGRQTLKVFCLLRGIRTERIAQFCEKLGRTFDFIKHIDKMTKFYSGGNKRKLSTAITIIGRISLVYLDEPTTGIDPVARRHLWSIISRMRDSGKSIMLTTHNMEECEALSTRLAIMVKGEFQCIGTPQHLKNKFAKLLTLKIKVLRSEDSPQVSRRTTDVSINVDSNDDKNSLPNTNIQRVKEFVRSNFPEATVQEEYQDLLTFKFPLASMTWSQSFGLIEKNKIELNIEDYSISQTTLEEFFIGVIQIKDEEIAETSS